jgi:hypothetical protein
VNKLSGILSVIAFFYITILACSKGDGGGTTPTPPPVTEENLRISTNASFLNVLPGAEFDFIVAVESKMPVNGVKIEYTVKGETDNVDYPQGPAIETKDPSKALKIVGIPRQKFCIVTVSVTSKTRASNIASTNFKVVYK